MSRLIAQVTEVLSPLAGLELTGPQWVRVRVRVTGVERGATASARELIGREGQAERAVRFGWELRVGKQVVLSTEEARQFLREAAAAPATVAKSVPMLGAARPRKGAWLPHPPRWGVSRQARGS